MIDCGGALVKLGFPCSLWRRSVAFKQGSFGTNAVFRLTLFCTDRCQWQNNVQPRLRTQSVAAYSSRYNPITYLGNGHLRFTRR